MKNLKKYIQIINNFKKAKVLVIGDIMLDHFIWGDVSRISPEAPVPIVEVSSESFMPGGAANVAMNLKGLNVSTSLVGALGNDLNQQILKRLLKKNDIPTDGLIVFNNRPTTKKTRIIAHNQQVVRVDRENKNYFTKNERKKLILKIRKILPSFDAVILEDYGKGFLSQEIIDEIVSLCKQHGVYSSIDPKNGHELDLSGIDLCTPNSSEAKFLSHISNTKIKNIKLEGDVLRKNLGVNTLLVTLGEDGMALFDKKGDPYHIPTQAREVFDVSGAGDTVISVFTAAIVSKANLFEAANLSNLAAGIVVGKLGTAIINLDELVKEVKIKVV